MIDKEQVFEYLDSLRESGRTNMFGAAPWLENAFGCDRYEARDLLLEWMQTFDTRHPLDNKSTS